MTEIETLYGKTYSDNGRKDPKFYIDNYESNRTLIEGSESTILNPDFDGILRLTSDYALSLSNYGSSRKALPYLDKSIDLFHKSSIKELNEVPIYEMLRLTRGIENYNFKNIKSATTDFEYLVKFYPDNDRYRDWLLAAKTYKQKIYLKTVWGITLFCLVFLSLSEKEEQSLRQILLWSVVACATVGALLELNRYFIKKEIKNGL